MKSGRGGDAMRVGLECHEVRWTLEKLRLTQALHTLAHTGPSIISPKLDDRLPLCDRTTTGARIECRYQTLHSPHHPEVPYTPWPRPSEHCALRSAPPFRARCSTPASPLLFLALMPQPPFARPDPTRAPTRSNRPARISLEATPTWTL